LAFSSFSDVVLFNCSVIESNSSWMELWSSRTWDISAARSAFSLDKESFSASQDSKSIESSDIFSVETSCCDCKSFIKPLLISPFRLNSSSCMTSSSRSFTRVAAEDLIFPRSVRNSASIFSLALSFRLVASLSLS